LAVTAVRSRATFRAHLSDGYGVQRPGDAWHHRHAEDCSREAAKPRPEKMPCPEAPSRSLRLCVS